MDKGKGNENIQWWQPGLILFGRLSGWIVGPVLLAIFIGKWLDEKYHSEPWLFLLSVGMAFAISMFGIVRDAMKAMREIDEESENKKKEE